ncbi:MAG: 5-formyltetrahydrofolate cyclo-ligase [Thermoguttaceae bacterium]|jgi:5-formyltetrahydrofolate cyclo-ligase
MAHDTLRQRKEQIRREAVARRNAQDDGEAVSAEICARLSELPEYAAARTILSYVAFRSEVRTHGLISATWQNGKRVVVPYCLGDNLELFRLESFEELAPGTLGILEPKSDLRARIERRVDLAALDLIVVPGLAFDPQCGRLGYGKGYYDRLLRRAAAETTLVALAFACQIFPAVPVLPWDVRVDKVITPATIYQRSKERLSGEG